jgi:ubiquinone/menaquinone biosynthesis C-methylase UbiE
MSSQQYFAEIAERWDQVRKELFPDALRRKACQAAGVTPGMVAVDVGAGSGFLTEELLAQGLTVIAVEPEEKMLAVMRRKLPDHPELELRRGAAATLPLADGEADRAFANMVLHHVEDPPAAIREMARVVKPGGRVVITDLDEHHHDFLRREHHDRWMGFRRADVHAWLEQAGLRDVTVEDAAESCCATSECGSESATVHIFLAMGERPVEGGDIRRDG